MPATRSPRKRPRGIIPKKPKHRWIGGEKPPGLLDIHSKLYREGMDVPQLHRYLFETFLEPGVRTRLRRLGYHPEHGFDSLRRREPPNAHLRIRMHKDIGATQEGINQARLGVNRLTWDPNLMVGHAAKTSEVRDAALAYLKELEIRLEAMEKAAERRRTA